MKRTLVLVLALAMLAMCAAPALAADAKAPGAVPERPLNGITLKVLLPYYATDPNLEPPAEMVTRTTGYKVEYFLLPQDGADDKLNLEMASGADYDLVRMNVNQFQNIAPKGALADLTSAVRDNPEIAALFNERELSTATIDGKILGIPQFDAHYVGAGIAINKEMFAKAGFEYKEGDSRQMTITQFIDLLRAVKEANPGVIPYVGNNANGGAVEAIMTSFGIVRHDWQYDLDGSTAVPRFGHSNMKAYLTKIREIYAEGLIDAEWPVNKGDTVLEKFTSGKAAAMWLGWAGATSTEAALKDATGDTVEYLLAPSDDSGFGRIGTNSGVQGFMVVPKASKQFDAVVDFLRIRALPEVFQATFLGVENVQWEYRDTKGDGVADEYWPLLPPEHEPGFSAWFNGHYFNTINNAEAFTTLWLCRCRKGPVQYAAFVKENEMPAEQWADNILVYAPPLAAVAQYQQSLNSMENDYVIGVIAGTRTVDEYESVYDEWLAEGGQEMIDAVNAYLASRPE